MRYFLFVCTLLSSCVRTHSAPLPPENSLPLPPHETLTNRSFFLNEAESTPINTSSIENILTSIERLHTHSLKTSYRTYLEELSSKLFQKLLESNDPEIVIMTVLAAASAHHPLSSTIALNLIRSPYPVIQLAAIQALSALNTNESHGMLIEALRSDYPVIRLEAAWHIANQKIPQAFYHIDALSHKLPKELLPYLPELFALDGSPLSIQRLKQLLLSPDEHVQIETILAIGKNKLSTFSDTLISFETYSPAVLEALAYSLQTVPTDASINRLKHLSSHTSENVSLQASLSLLALGDSSHTNIIEYFARSGNPFALFSLGSLKNSIQTPIIPSDRTNSINLSFSELVQRNKAALPFLKMVLSLPESELILMNHSSGNTLFFWDIAFSETRPKELLPSLAEESLRAKEYFLSLALELQEQYFLEIASFVFKEGLYDLYPCLLQLLENKQSDNTISLLQEESIRVGAPYNRAYATLGLVKIKKSIDIKDLTLILELSREKNAQSWRFPIPWVDNTLSNERSNAQQTTMLAHLYINTLSTLAETGSNEAIQILISELSLTPKKYLPFVVSALLHATL